MNSNEFDFEDMRQQMDTLRKKLEQQQIVNDRVVRRAIRKNVGSINSRYLQLSVICLFMIPLSYWIWVVQSGFSPAFGIVTIIYFLICLGYYYWNGRDMRSDSLLDDDLVETSRKVALAKKRDSNWLWYGIPMAILWLAWLGWENYQKAGEAGFYSFLFTVGFGGVIGGIIGLRIHFKTQRQYQEIIDQIEEITRQ